MKKKVITLIIAGILTVGGISVAYASTRSNTTFNNTNRQMMGAGTASSQTNDRYNDMIKVMEANGFNDQANAMANRDFDAMNEFMGNISDADYEKMIDIMQENGYGPMADRMKSIGKEGMKNMQQGMMGR